MIKRVTAIVLMMIICLVPFGVCAVSNDAYMGFSVGEDWYVFSKNMTDTALLETFELTAEEVNEALLNSDCEHFITNLEKNIKIYVKVKKNAVSDEFYNILETEDQMITDHLDRILKDGFSVDGFSYDPMAVTVTEYPQMKFITVPGTVQYESNNQGMVVGFTFVNGNGIAFIMHLDHAMISEEHMGIFSELASSVSFTQIKEKGEAVTEETAQEASVPSAIGYIGGGFAALLLTALLLFLISRMRKSGKS